MSCCLETSFGTKASFFSTRCFVPIRCIRFHVLLWLRIASKPLSSEHVRLPKWPVCPAARVLILIQMCSALHAQSSPPQTCSAGLCLLLQKGEALDTEGWGRGEGSAGLQWVACRKRNLANSPFHTLEVTKGKSTFMDVSYWGTTKGNCACLYNHAPSFHSKYIQEIYTTCRKYKN